MRIDRIITLVFLIAITQAFLLIFDPAGGFFATNIDQNLVFPLTVIILAALVLITMGIADAVVRSHPQIYLVKLPTLRLGRNKFEIAPFAWIIPGMLVVGSYLFIRLFADAVVQISGTILFSLLILLVVIAQYYSLGRQSRYYGWAVIGLNITTYLTGFLIFSSVYVNKWRAFISAPLIGLTGLLLAYELLRQTRAPGGKVLTACLITGIILGEVAFALNYWAVSALVGGIVPLLICYILIGLLQAHLTGNLNKAVLREYLAVSVISIALVVWAVLANIKLGSGS
ncbi:hypothetical protein [Candidatus Chlorohelix sp.]|uniref:DUF5656 family protein n=1 Tax=Candidatus Chlorohelix sp. TaxID=3139201 RepID=UPI00303D3A40